MKDLNLIGMFRVGTNFARSVLELNYETKVNYNSYGWKHGPIPTFNKESDFYYPDSPCICVVKSPLATVASWWKYVNDTKKNIKSDADSFSDFIREPVIFYDEWSDGSPEYWFSNPFDMWNSLVWNHTSFVEKNGGIVVRYEDLIDDAEKTCEKISKLFFLSRKTSEFITVDGKARNMNDSLTRDEYGSYVQGKKFDRLNYFKNEEFFNEYSKKDMEFASDVLSSKLLEKLNYSLVRKTKSGGLERLRDKPEIYTMCSDSRVYDLAVLLESSSRLGYRLNVIPYDDNLQLTRDICRIYNATIIERDPFWDDLGKKFFAESDHGSRGVKAWRYFRKFNAITSARGDFLFIDANAAFFEDVIPCLEEAGSDIVFAHRSSPGRNFKPWGKYLISHMDSNFGEGFGADFWFVKSGAIKKSYFESLFNYPGFKHIVSVSPEQAFLNIIVSIKGLKYNLLQDVSKGVCYFICSKVEKYTLNKEGFFYYKGNRVAISKWTGDYHNGKSPFNHKDMHRPFAKAAMNRVFENADLYDVLGEYYSKICGHEFVD